MPSFSANLTMMFTEFEFRDRFAAAADAGFAAVECLFPYSIPPSDLQSILQRHDLRLAMFNLQPGDWAAGERGLASLPNRFDELKDTVSLGIEYAQATGVGRLHMMAGMASPGDAAAEASYRRAVDYAAGALAERGLELLLEPINGRSMPGYFLDSFSRAQHAIATADSRNVRLQYDFFHRQIMHGDVTQSFKRLTPSIGHVQIASVPSRHEPADEELNYPFLFEMIDASGYDGFVGCEYNPRTTTLEGLDWFAPYSRKR